MLIETKKLTKKYENAKNLIAVDQAEICVDHGETVGLFGESGSGKSTLGLMLAGLERPTSGEIFLKKKRLQCPIVVWCAERYRFCFSIRKFHLIRH